MPTTDNRLVVGSNIHLTIARVLNDADAARFFGGMAKKGHINGVVNSVGKKNRPLPIPAAPATVITS